MYSITHTVSAAVHKCKKVRDDISGMTKLSELLDYISYSTLEQISAAFLYIFLLQFVLWGIWNAVFGARVGAGEMQTITATYIYLWSSSIRILGLLACINGTVGIAKYIQSMGFKAYLRSCPVSLLLFLLLLWGTLSSFFAADYTIAFLGDEYRKEGLLNYYVYFGFFLSALQIHDKKIIHRAAVLTVVTSLILAPTIIFYNDWLKELLNMKYMPRANPFMNINHTAYFLCVSSAAAAALFLSAKTRRQRVLYAICFCINIGALCINNTFGPYLAVIGGLAVLLILCALYRRKWVKNVLILFVLLTVSSFIASPAYMIQNLSILFGDIFKILENSEDIERTGSGRWKLWCITAQYICDHPLFGSGPEGLAPIYVAHGSSPYMRPHCVPLQIAGTLGIPAGILYLSALIRYICYFLRKNTDRTSVTMLLFFVGSVYFISSLVGNSMFYTTPYFCMIWGMAIRSIHPTSDSNAIVL